MYPPTARRGLGSRSSKAAVGLMGGFDEVTFRVKGDTAWTHLKHEGGPHRVQRVPVTESQGRIHTTSATVTVLPEAEEVDIEIDPNDLQIDVYRLVRPGRADRSTPPTRRCASPTSRPAWSCRCRTRRARLQNQAKACRCCGPPPQGSSRTAGGRAIRQRARPDRRRRPLREDPHLQLQGEPGHRSPHRADPSTSSTGRWRASSTRWSTPSSRTSDDASSKPRRG